MAHRPTIGTLTSQFDREVIKTPSTPSAGSCLSFTSASEISNESFVGVEYLADSAPTDPIMPLLSLMETTLLSNHSEYYMQDGMVKFKVGRRVSAGRISGA